MTKYIHHRPHIIYYQNLSSITITKALSEHDKKGENDKAIDLNNRRVGGERIDESVW